MRKKRIDKFVPESDRAYDYSSKMKHGEYGCKKYQFHILQLLQIMFQKEITIWDDAE